MWGVLSHVIDLPKELVGNDIFNVGGAWAPQLSIWRVIQRRCSVVLFYSVFVQSRISTGEFVSGLLYRQAVCYGFYLDRRSMSEIDATLRLLGSLQWCCP